MGVIVPLAGLADEQHDGAITPVRDIRGRRRTALTHDGPVGIPRTGARGLLFRLDPGSGKQGCGSALGMSKMTQVAADPGDK